MGLARLRLEAHFHTEKGLVKHAFVQDGLDQGIFSPGRGDDLERELVGAAKVLAEWWEGHDYGKDLADWRFTTGPEFEAAEDRNRRIASKRSAD